MNQLGQCGIKLQHNNYNYNCILQMIPIPNLINIISIACGQNHSLFLNNNGKVYCCGSNEEGQLGFINQDLDNTSVYIPILQKILNQNEQCFISKIKCGQNHSLFIDNNKNNAYLCGNNIHGQIGNNKKDISHVYEPYFFKFNNYTNQIIDGECGIRHTVLLNKNRDTLITFGSNIVHQCSPKSSSEYMFEPYILTKDEIGIKNKKEKISHIRCGTDTTLVITIPP